MKLSDLEIKKRIKNNDISIEPLRWGKITGISVDVRLGNELLYIGDVNEAVDPSDENYRDKLKKHQIKINLLDSRFILNPEDFVIAHTEEFVKIPRNLVGYLDGKSGLARLGLMIHLTAHRIDPGFQGQIVLEIKNSGNLPIALSKGMEIGALTFERIEGEVDKDYLDKMSSYKLQKGACL